MSVFTKNETISMGDFKDTFSLLPISASGEFLYQLCKNTDQKHSLKRIVETIENNNSDKDVHRQVNPSITLLSGGSGRGKQSLISLGIVAALEKDIVDIFVIASNDTILTKCSDNIQLNLKHKGEDMTNVHLRRHERYYILEVVRGAVTHKIRFIRFDQQFCKYDTGLLCVIEIGQLSILKINKILSYNPSLVWATASTSGPMSTGTAVFESIVRPLRSFCGVGETLPNNVDETSTKNGVTIREISNKAVKKMFINITLNAPIIYDDADPLESVMNDVFCLTRKPEIKQVSKSANNFYPAPSDCEFMYVNKETLFSGHTATELFLSRFMEVYTSFDDKRSSDFLQPLVDDPSHHLFCLQQPANIGKSVPQILCIIHVCIDKPADKQSASLRIVHLITNSKFQHLGYASNSLTRLYNFVSQSATSGGQKHAMMASVARFTTVDLVPLDTLPRLLLNVVDMSPWSIKIDYLSCRFVASNDLLCFWKKCSFLVATIEPVTETSMQCTMVRDCSGRREEDRVDGAMYRELCETIADKYTVSLRDVDVTLAHEILFHKNKYDMPGFRECDLSDIKSYFDSRQLRKLDSFVQNCHSFESVQELVHDVAVLYFSRKFPGVFLPKYQELTLVGFGLQMKSPKQLSTEIVLREKYQTTNIVDPFSLHKDIQKNVPLVLSHIRECARVFLNQVTRIIETTETEETPAKKRKLM